MVPPRAPGADAPGEDMTATASALGPEGRLAELADRLARQEETTRRLEATLHALARLPEGRGTGPGPEALILTPRAAPARTPRMIPWPARRADPAPLPA